MVRGFEKHILTQFALGWCNFLTMGVMFWFLPHFVQGILIEPPTPRAERIFEWHHYFVFASFVLCFTASELASKVWRKNKTKKTENVLLQKHIKAMAKRAGLWRVPDLAVVEGRMNAAAFSSIFSGSFVISMGRVSDVLTVRQQDAVFAHELSHIKNWDNFAHSIIRSGSLALRLQLNLLLGLVFLGYTFNRSHGKVELSYIWHAFWWTFLMFILYQLCSLAHSRAREYLADTGAISILGEDYRDELIGGIIAIGNNKSKRHPFDMFRRSGLKLFRSHPELADRAEALKVAALRTESSVELIETRVV